MDERNYYVICENNCKFPALTKEQTLAAITQAIETGEIKDVDTGFVTKIKEQNNGVGLSFWVGTTAEYNAIEAKQHNCFYILTDDEKGDELKREIAEIKKALEAEKKGLPPLAEIIVTDGRGSVTCHNEQGELIAGQQNGDKWIFGVSKYGLYTITGTYDKMKKTKEINVTAVQQYNEIIEYFADRFGDNDVATIIEVVQSGTIPATWTVGSTLEIITGTVTTQIKIIGKNHDEYIDGTIAPFTFIASCEEFYGAMEATRTNEYGWRSSDMRTKKMPNAKAYLGGFASAIREVKKQTSKGNEQSDIVVTQDTLFLLSEVERLGTTTLSFEGEGTQYEYYKNGNGGSEEMHWLRSPVKSNSSAYVIKSSGGGASTKNAEVDTNYMPAFCL